MPPTTNGGLLDAPAALPAPSVPATASAFGVAPASQPRSVWKEVCGIVRQAQAKRLETSGKLTAEEQAKRAQSYAEQAVSDVWLALSQMNKRIFDHYPVCGECRGILEAEAEVVLARAQALADKQWAENQADGERYRAEMAARQ